MIGATDDPIDSLDWHKKIRDEKRCSAAVLPSFRPDKAINYINAAKYFGIE